MSAKSEYDAAYFSLLRAREDLEHMTRYQQFLDGELAWLSEVDRHFADAGAEIPRKFTKPVDATLPAITEAVGRRRAQIQAELAALPERIAVQEAFILESEAEVDALRP